MRKYYTNIEDIMWEYQRLLEARELHKKTRANKYFRWIKSFTSGYKTLISHYKRERNPDMKQKLINDARDQLRDLESNLRKAKARLKFKRGQLIREVQQDTPDLFGERRTDSPEKLFNPVISPEMIDKALEPIRAEIADYERQIDKWQRDILRLVDMPENDLFTNSKVA